MTPLKEDESIKGLIYENGRTFFNAEDTLVVFGMSTDSSFFNLEKIKEYITYFSYKPQHTLIFVPETPAQHTYSALGKPDPRKLAHKKAMELMARARKAVESLPTSGQGNFTLLNWVVGVDTDPSYKCHVHSLYKLHDEGGQMHRETCDAANTRLANAGFQPQSAAQHEASVTEAARYLIDELAFFSAMHDRYKKNICFVYRRPNDVMANYAAGLYDGEAKDWLGMVVLK